MCEPRDIRAEASNGAESYAFAACAGLFILRFWFLHHAHLSLYMPAPASTRGTFGSVQGVQDILGRFKAVFGVPTRVVCFRALRGVAGAFSRQASEFDIAFLRAST